MVVDARLGRCLHINDPAMKTRHVDVSCGFFLLNEVHQQNQNIMYHSPVTSIPYPMEHFERSSRKVFLLVVLLGICSRGGSVVRSVTHMQVVGDS